MTKHTRSPRIAAPKSEGRALLLASTAIAIGLSFAPVGAQAQTWDGSESTFKGNGDNWVGGVAPSDTAAIIITNGNFQLEIDGREEVVDAVVIENSGVLTIFDVGSSTGSLTATTSATLEEGGTLQGKSGFTTGTLITPTYIQTGGQMAGNVSASTSQTLTGGTVSGTLSGAGAVTVGGPVELSGTIASENVTINGSGTLTNTSGGLADGTELVIEASGNLVLTSSDTIGGLTGGGDVSLSGGTTTLTYNSTLAPSTYAGDINGAGNLNVTDGVLILQGTNGYTGNTTVTGAAILLSPGASLASTDITLGALGAFATYGGLSNTASITGASTSTFQVFSDETIAALNTAGDTDLSGTSTLTLANGASSITGVITGPGGMIVDGAAADVTFTAANDYTGGTTVASGSLTLETGGSLGADAGSTTVTGGTLTLNNADTQAGVTLTGGTIAGTGVLSSITYVQSGGLLSGTVNASGDQSLNGGTIAGTLAGAGAVTVGGSVLLSGTIASDTISINGMGNLTTEGDGLSDSAVITNAGTLTLTGAETVAGVNGAGGIALNGGDLSLRSGASSISGVVSGTNGLNVIGGIVTVSGANTYQGGTEVSSGSLTVTSDGTLGNSTAGTGVSGGTLTIENETTQGSVTLSGTGTIAGSQTLNTGTYTQSGGLLSGTIDASVDQSLTGGTISGALSGAGAVTVGGSVELSGTIASEDMTINGSSTLTSSNGGLADGLALTIESGSALALGASDTIGSLSGASGALVALDVYSLSISGTDSTSFAGSMTGGATSVFDVTGGGQTTLSGVINTLGKLVATDGTLILTNGSNSIADIEVGGGAPGSLGILRIETTGAAGGALITTLGSVIDYGDTVDLASAIVLNSNDTQLQVLTGNATQSGAISETGGARPIKKIGAGTLALTGANTYSGGTLVTAGGLTVATGGTLGATTGSTTVNGGTLTIDTATTQAGVELITGTIAGAGVLSSTTYDQSGGQMDGNVSATGLQSLNGGTVSGTLSGTGNVTVGGTVLLSGSITSEAVTIGGSSAGTLTNTNGGLAAGTDLDIQANGGLVLTADESIASLNSAVDGNVTLSGAGTDLTITDGGTLSVVAGNISGAGGLNVNGGEVQLNGTNTYSGATTLMGTGNVLLNGSLDAAGGDAHVEIASGSQFTVLSAAGGLENTATVDNAGNFQVHTYDETIGAINGAGGIRLNNGDLTLSTGASSISGAIVDYLSGTGGLIVDGGAVTLSGANTYTGGTAVDSGSLTLETGGSLGADSGSTTVNGGTLTLNTADTQAGVTLTGGTIAGAGVLSSTTYTQSGGQMAGNVSATGLQSLNDGTVSGTLSGTGNVTVGGSVLLSGSIASENVTIGGSSAGTLTNTNGGLAAGTDLVIQANGGLVLTADESIASLSSAAGGNVTLSGAGTDLTITNGATTSFVAGDINGDGNLNVTGGQLNLQGTNGYTGNTTVTGATILLFPGASLASSDITLGASGILATYGGLSNTASITGASTSTFQVSRDETIAALNTSGNTTIETTRTLTLANGASSITGAIQGSGGLIVDGATADVTFTAANTYTGGTTVASGSLTLETGGSLGADSGSTTVTGGTLTLNTADTQAGVTLTGGTIAGAGVLSSTTYTQSGGQMAGNVSATGLQSLNGGTVSGTLSGTGNVTVGGSVLLSGSIASENVTIGGSSAGTLTNTNGGLAAGTDLVIQNNGGLVLTADESIASLNSAAGGNVTLSGAGTDLTITDGAAASSIAGSISGAGGLIVDGGDVTVSGANSYTGDTTVTGGGLTVATGGTLGATTNDTTVDGGTLTINADTTQADVALDSGTINGSATLITTTYEQSGGQMAGNVSASGLQNLIGGTITGALSGMGNVSVTGATVYVTLAGTIASTDVTITGSGGLSTDGGALADAAEIQNAGALTLTGAETIMSLNGNGTLALDGGDLTLADGTSTISGVISGGNGLTVDGGDVTISGTANTFTGPTTVADGTLDLTGNVGGNASVTGGGAVLNVNGGTVGGTTTNDGGTINIDDGTFTGLVANMNGTLTGTGAVIGNIENQDIMTVATGKTLNVTGSVTVTGGGTFSTNGGTIITSTGLFNTSNSLIELTNATIGGSTTNSARILALGNNTIGALNNTGGTIDMRNGATTDVLNTGAITGGGLVQLNVNLDALDTVNGGTSDLIISSGLVSGAFNFEFTPLGASATYLGAPITVMDVTPGSSYTIANFSGLPVGGLAVYSLEKNGTTGDAELISETSSGIAGIGANASLVQALIGSVVNRPSSPFVSGLASEEGCSQGGYFRGTYGKANVTGTSFNGVRSQETELVASYGGVQAGWDFGCNDGRFFDGWDGTFGALIGYNTGSTDQNVVVPSGIGNGTVVTSVTKTDFDQTYVGAYAAFNKDRLTADVQVRMERSKFTLNETVIGNFFGLGLDNAKFDAKSFNVTGRVSYRMDVDTDAGISFVPTAGFSYSRTGASVLDFDGGERLEMSSFNSFVGFAGGTLAKTTINEAGDAGTTLFVGGNYYHDFAGDRDSLFKYDVNDENTWQNITTDSIGGFGEISLGVNYVKILDNGPGGAKQLNANIRADGRVGKNISNAASITGQIRLSF